MNKIKDETGIYVELPREKIKFYGDTEKERKLNETIFDISLEYSEVCDENDELKKEVVRLNNIINEIKEIIEWAYEESEYEGALYSIEKAIKSDKELKEK